MTTATTPAADLTGSYTLDPTHTRLGFVARHAMVTKVRGSFGEFEASANLDFTEPANSSAVVVIQVASVETGQKARDEHLRTNDFFDVPSFPTWTFASTGVEVKGGDEFVLVGDLTIKDVTKSVRIDFEHTGTATDPFGNFRAGFEGRTTISRKDFGVTWNAPLEAGGVMVGDKIVLEFDVSAIKV